MQFAGDFVRRMFRKVHSYFIPTRHNAYRPRLLHKAWLLFFLALILTAEGVLLTNVFAGASARDFLAAVLPGEVVALTNLERGFNNIATVKENTLLTRAAEAKARDMAGKGYFAHVGPDGKEPWAWVREAGYTYQSAGENLAVRFNESEDVVRAWMASPGHRANIVKPSYTEIGVGVAQGTYKGAPATFVVQYFGRPSVVPVVAEPTPALAATDGAGTPQVLGVEAEAVAKGVVTKTVAGVGAVPSVQAIGILTAAALFLLVLVSLTFVINIQVQPVDLLLGGAGVAAVAVALLVLNFSFVTPLPSLSQ
ncbi:MAG: CAP domain-containing protein, partial [Patescibacteria group bacterium]|nr:CAP domain-containing protein [Patescibacteria group bacterium]